MGVYWQRQSFYPGRLNEMGVYSRRAFNQVNTVYHRTCRKIEMEALGSCICQQKLFQFLLLLKLEKGAQYWFSTDTSGGCHKKPGTKTFFMWDLLKELFQATIHRGIAQYHGRHTLQQKVKKLCANAGVVGHKTNHSLRASSATAMVNAGIPKKLIQERTGHRSLDALRT